MSKRHASDEPTGAETPAKRSRLGDATPTPDPELAREPAAAAPLATRIIAATAAAQTSNGTTTTTTNPPTRTVSPSERSIEDATADLDLDDDSSLTNRAQPASIRQSAPTAGYDDLYLDTIDRNVLDFDFEKLCSVSLSNINVYACLVCGRYFQGRGPRSHAYFHALDEDHHVFINLETQRVYVLPEGYEVRSRALDDIKYVADPRYTRDEVVALDRPRVQDQQQDRQQQKQQHQAWTLSGQPYTPGFVGMNNIKENDYVNVVVQALAHVAPLRDYFLLKDFSGSAVATRYSELVRRCSTLVRKVWNPRAFRAHVSPHELLQEVALRSGKRFTLTQQSDPVDFLSWFLNNLHLGLGGSKSRPGSSMVQRVFQGRLKVESQAITARADEVQDRLRFEESAEVKVDVARFMLLTLDLPPPPLFQDEIEGNIIPQVHLETIMAKYDGRRAQEHLAQRKRYRLLHPLPPYLVLHVKRFSQNKFVTERNPTIVIFDPRAGLDVSPYVDPSSAADGGAEGYTTTPGEPIMYDLVANVVHEAVRSKDVDGVADSGDERKTWKVQVRDRATDEWVSCQDLYVEKTQAEMLYLGETYVQIWERRKRSRQQR